MRPCPLCDALVHPRTPIATLPYTQVLLHDQQGAAGWCVCVLREHVEHLDALPIPTQAAVFAEVARVARAVRSTFPTSGADGGPPRINYECLGNVVGHVHWHVIPRHADDPAPTATVWTWDRARLDGTLAPDTRAALAARIAGHLSDGD